MMERSFATHDGTFHADELTACALLLLFERVDRKKIYRTRDPNVIDQCEYVCDVGKLYDPKKKRFDHHQFNYQGSFSSAGMVLQYLYEEGVLKEDLYRHFKEELIDGIDAFDMGNVIMQKGQYTFSEVIANFLPIEYEATPQQEDEAFFKALDFLVPFLERMQKRFIYQKQFQPLLEKEMKKKKDYLIFDQPFPWKENFFLLGGETHPAKFVIMPTQNQWKLRCIPPSMDDQMNMRIPHPEKWAGLYGDDLVKATNIAGAIFCHKSRFISIWKTKEDAIQALKQILKQEVES